MRTKQRLRRGIAVVAAVALAALSVAMVTPLVQQAGAQVVPITLNAEPNSNTALSFDLSVPEDECAAETALTVTGNAIEITPLSLTITDPNTLAVVLPPTTEMPLEFTVTCLDSQEQDVIAQVSREFFSIPVTKTLEGDVPVDASFTVNVACVPSETPVEMTSQAFGPQEVSVTATLSVDLAFGPEGGMSYVFGYQASDCVISEPVNGGATTTAITPATVNTDEPGVYPVSVVNTFVAVPTFTG
jgi:hypothetical protein